MRRDQNPQGDPERGNKGSVVIMSVCHPVFCFLHLLRIAERRFKCVTWVDGSMQSVSTGDVVVVRGSDMIPLVGGRF